MKHTAAGERLALASSTLVGAILYHLTLTSSILPVGYLTFADEFMIVNYMVVSIALSISVILMQYNDRKKEEKAKKLYQRTQWTAPLNWLFLMAALIYCDCVLLV